MTMAEKELREKVSQLEEQATWAKMRIEELEARLDEMPKPAGSGDDVAVFKQQLVDRLEVEAEACNGQNQATRAVMAVQVAVESTIGEE